jgi:hypothetical protein
MADWSGVPFRRMLSSAERLSDSAIFLGSFQVNTPGSRSSALLRFVTSADQGRGFGAASGGLEAVNASTSFSLSGSGIVMEAPLAAHETARVKFKTIPTPGEFPTLQAGDAVNFGIFREDRDTANDTCDQELGIAGISIVYTTP